MKVNEGMKKLLSLLLAFTMVLSYVPMGARAEEVCTHHVHDENCGYVEAVKGSDCAHQCTDSCVTVDVTNCIHDHEAEGCPYTPAVEAAACDYVHGEGCGHVYAQAEVPCTCGGVSVHADGCASLLTEGAECDCTPTLTHAEGCEPRDAVAESCSHVHGDCAYREAAGESWDCDHVCTVDTGCVKAVCTHVCPEGDCGFVQAVAGRDCTFECTECKTEDEPACTCESTDPGEHAPFCDLYVRTYEECLCQLSCAEEGLNEWCETCYFEGVASCTGGEDEASAYLTDTDYTITNGKLVIHDGVTTIDNFAFYENTVITSVEIPASVTQIGNYAFYGCSSLESVSIPGSVTRIGNSAFCDCSSLTTVAYEGMAEPPVAGSYVFDGTGVSVVEVPAGYEGDTFCDLPVNKNNPAESTTHTVTVSASPAAGGTVTGGGTYEEGDKVTLTATPAEGYKFVNWTENGSVVSTNAAYTFTVTGNRTLVANFEEKPLEISLSIGTAYANTITDMYRGDNGTMYCTITFSKPDPVGRMHMYVDGVKKNASWDVRNITGTTVKKTRSTGTNLKIGKNTVKFEFVPSGSTESYFTNEIVVTMHKIDSTRLLKHLSNDDKAVVVEYDEEKAVEVTSLYDDSNTLYLGPEDYTITYWKDGVSTTEPTEPGVYTVTISIHGNDYYEKMDDVPLTATLTINPPPHTHDWSYSASGDTITATCLTDSDHTFTATLEAENATYTGTAITTASIAYPENWPGEKPTEISYSDNVNVGTATAQITVEGQKLTATFDIAPYDISGENITVVLNPSAGTYTGKRNKPEVTVKFHDTELTGGTDYGYSWSGELVNPDTYTVMVQGIDNFIGVNRTATYTIGKADLTNVSVGLASPLTYTGEPQTPVFAGSADTVDGSPATFAYSTSESGSYDDEISFTNAGTYTVYYKASAPNHNDATGSFEVTVAKQVVTPPTIASKPYTGELQTADVPDSDLYLVLRNDGGTHGGDYPVVLGLNDPNNYTWPDTHMPSHGLTFTITPADNAWATEPTIAGWTYGNAPSAPAMGEPVYGKETTYVRYVGTTNAGADYGSMEAPTEAGEYKAVFTVPETDSYGELKKEVPFTVKRAVPTVSGFAYTEPTLTYNGLEQFVAVTTGMEGVEANNIILNYSAEPRNAGDYTFTVTVPQTDNYEAATLTSDAWKFTIDKAEPVISWDATEFTYNAQPQGEAKVTLENDEVYSGTIQYSYGPNETSGTKGLPTNAGTYVVIASIEGQDNYLPAINQAAIVIKAKEVTPTVELSEDSVTYNGEAHKPAVKVMDGDTVIPAKEYTVSYSSNKDVGKASVTIRDAEGGNYTVNETIVYFLILPDTTELDKLDEDTVTSDDTETIQDVLDSIQPEDLEGISDEAKAAWEAITEKCEDLQDAVDQAKENADAVTDKVTKFETSKPTTGDLNTLEEILEAYKASEGNMTEEEKAAVAEDVKKLEDKIDDLHKTEEKIDDIQETVEELEEKDLTFGDKETIQDVLEEIEETLEKDENLSASDKNELNESKKDAEDLLKEFEEADKVTEQLNKLPESADPDDDKAIEAYEKALEAYNKLGKDQAKVDPAAAGRLEKLNKALTDYKIIKGNGTKWVKGSSTGLAITANGAYSKFVSVEINGRELAKSNYTVKSGSTVVILNANYLNKLKTGKYNIDINYPDGSAEGHFQIVTWDENPFTGDRIMMAFAVMSLSAAALVVLLANKKRFKV